MSAVDATLIKLKLEKRLIQEKLKSTDEKYERLRHIAETKAKLQQTISTEKPSYTKVDLPLSTFLLPIHPEKSLPKVERRHVDKMVEPKINESRILMNLKNKLLLEHQTRDLERKKREREFEERKAKDSVDKIKSEKTKIPPSFLPNRYLRGELPCTIEHGANGNFLSWMCPLNAIDYEYYLPIFFDGLQCTEHPCKFIARQGIEDLLYASIGNSARILKCLKKLIMPMRNALLLFNPSVSLAVVKVVQQIIRGNADLGEPLLHHGRQFLAPLVPFMDKTRNLGDGIDYRQQKADDLGEEVGVPYSLSLFSETQSKY